MANTDYGAVLLTACEATSQALNHRLGVSTGFKPSEWADNINLLVKPAEKSASGSVAHFTDGLDMPLVSLSCDVTAWQEGAGTASPSNPRPIHGWSGANIKISGADTSDYENTNIPFGQTVYGGRLNVTTGELTITHQINTFTRFDSQAPAQARLPVRVYTTYNTDCYGVTTKGLLCDKALPSTSSEGTSDFDNVITCRMSNGTLRVIWFFLPLDIASDLTEANAWIAENPITLVYQLLTPTTITLTPHQLSSLLGENNIWADCGDSAVVYRGMVGDSFKCFFNSQVTSGWTGTSVERTMLTITAKGNGSITFDNNGKGRTNCSNSDGYISVRKNGTAVYTKSLAPNTDETLAIPVVNFSAGDVITLVFGFANYHSNINMKLTGDSFTVQGSATVSGISNTTNTSTTLEVST